MLGKIQGKIERIWWRMTHQGLQATFGYTIHLFLSVLSPQYRFNPTEARKRSIAGFVVFIVRDSVHAFEDRLVTLCINAFGRRSEIPKRHLANFSFYFLDPRIITKDSIVYSFGVGKNIDFDKALVNRYGSTVYLFDPTPPALAFMKTQPHNPHLIFTPIGLWTETRSMKFYLDRLGTKSGNLSITNFFQTENYIEAECLTLEDVMHTHGHDHIDILKLDIEGAGLPVLEQMLTQALRPRQIVAELEVPKRIYGATFREVFSFFRRRQNLFRALHREGYAVVTYGKAEFLAVKRFAQ